MQHLVFVPGTATKPGSLHCFPTMGIDWEAHGFCWPAEVTISKLEGKLSTVHSISSLGGEFRVLNTGSSFLNFLYFQNLLQNELFLYIVRN